MPAVASADADSIQAAVRRELLRMALRNSARSVPLLTVVVCYLAWLAWQAAAPLVAALVLALGLPVAAWRLALSRRWAGQAEMAPAAMDGIVWQLEANAALVGLMWVLATAQIYPRLDGVGMAVYVGIVCGSVATAAFFMSMAGRSFLVLSALQLGSLASVSLWPGATQSLPLSLLTLLFGVTMLRVTREFGDTARRAMRLGLVAQAANAELQSAREAAEAASLAKSQFLATMSHEIRTPMNGVLGSLDLLRQTRLDERQQGLVSTASSSSAALMEILDDVLDHSRIEAGKLELAALPMSLHAVAASSAALFRASAESRGLVLQLQIDPGVPDAVVGDAARLKQVLLNLLGNAVKFTEQGGVTLRLALLPPADAAAAPPADAGAAPRVRFAVSDTGIGIAAPALREVFKPFYQVDGSHARLRGGSGLGLAISQRIVKAMGGCIAVTSRPGEGSEFAFTLALPLAPGAEAARVDADAGAIAGVDADADAHPEAETDAYADGTAAAGTAEGPLSGVVLLVEDHVVNRMVGAEMLKSLGLEVLVAEHGAQALALLAQRRVDLVLMDVQMPVMDGYAATRALREREARLGLARLPVIALSANAFAEDAARSLEAGMDAHLAKPCPRSELQQLLRRWL